MCLCQCPVVIKLADYRSATLKKLKFFTGIFQRFWLYNQLDTLITAIFKNIYFYKTPSSMTASVNSLNSNDQYIRFSTIETFAGNC